MLCDPVDPIEIIPLSKIVDDVWDILNNKDDNILSAR